MAVSDSAPYSLVLHKNIIKYDTYLSVVNTALVNKSLFVNKQGWS
jgi:hypothetical protein